MVATVSSFLSATLQLKCFVHFAQLAVQASFQDKDTASVEVHQMIARPAKLAMTAMMRGIALSVVFHMRWPPDVCMTIRQPSGASGLFKLSCPDGFDHGQIMSKSADWFCEMHVHQIPDWQRCFRKWMAAQRCGPLCMTGHTGRLWRSRPCRHPRGRGPRGRGSAPCDPALPPQQHTGSIALRDHAKVAPSLRGGPALAV